MENNPIYTDNEQMKGIFAFIVFLFFGIYTFQHQKIAGIFIFIASFIIFISTLARNSRLILNDDKIIIEYLTTKHEIPFSKIKRIFSEERYYGKGFARRIYLVIEYTESSGFGGEISYIFDQKMYDDINEKYTSYKLTMNKI